MKTMLLLITLAWLASWGFLAASQTAITASNITARNVMLEQVAMEAR